MNFNKLNVIEILNNNKQLFVENWSLLAQK